MFHMSPSRKPMPSFTLVLTSGLDSLSPTAIKFDSHVSPKTLPTAPDYLMKTIDLRGNSKDALGDICDDVNRQTIFEAERPEAFDHGAEQTGNNSIKQNFLFLIRKFVPYKRNSISHGPRVALKN